MSQKSLLIIEDDRSTREAVQRFFISRGWEVAMVATQAEGMRLLDDYEPDWIVVAWEQLEGSGEPFLHALQARPQRPRVALLTDPMDARRAALTIRLKTEARFRKPINPEEIHRICEAAWNVGLGQPAGPPPQTPLPRMVQ